MRRRLESLVPLVVATVAALTVFGLLGDGEPDTLVPLEVHQRRPVAPTGAAPDSGPGFARLHGFVQRGLRPIAGARVVAHSLAPEQPPRGVDCGAKREALTPCGCFTPAGRVLERVERLSPTPAPLATAVTDPNGYFQLLVPDSRAVALEASFGDELVWERASPGDDLVMLQLRVARYVEGRVLAPPDVLAKTSVLALMDNSTFSASGSLDAQGHFRIGPVPQAQYAVVANAEGFAPAVVEEVHWFTFRQLQLELCPGRRIAGHVLRDGSPVAHAEVSFLGVTGKRCAVSDERGAFSFEMTEPLEEVVLAARAPGASGHAKVHLGTGEANTLATLELRADRIFSGEVIDDEGRAVPGATLRFDEGLWGSKTEAGDGGSFALSLPSGTRPATVEITAPGFLSGWVRVPKGDQHLTVRLSRGKRALGRVIDAFGKPLDGALVAERIEPVALDAGAPRAGRNERPLSTRTGDGGLFDLLVAPHRRAVVVKARGFAETIAELPSSGAPLEVALTGGGVIVGTVRESDGGVAVGVGVVTAAGPLTSEDAPITYTDTAGRFVLTGMAPGRWLLHFTGSWWKPRQGRLRPSVEVQVGGSDDQLETEVQLLEPSTLESLTDALDELAPE